MKRLMIALVALTGGVGVAQTAPELPNNPKLVQRVVEVKNADVRQLADVLIMDGGPRVKWNEHFRTISLFGTETSIAEAEALIKRFDTPRAVPPSRAASRNIELTVYAMAAAPKGTAGEAAPADLDAVIKQLKSLFGYNDFRILDSAILRTREGDAGSTSGTASFVGAGGQAPVSTYQIAFGKTLVSTSERGNVVRIDDFRFNIRAPYSVGQGQWQFSEIGFRTNLDIREGQKVVVGKAKYDGSDQALVLVVAAKVTE